MSHNGLWYVERAKKEAEPFTLYLNLPLLSFLSIFAYHLPKCPALNLSLLSFLSVFHFVSPQDGIVHVTRELI